MPPIYATGTRERTWPYRSALVRVSHLAYLSAARVSHSSGSDSSTKATTLGSVSEMNVAHVGHAGAALTDDVLLHKMREA